MGQMTSIVLALLVAAPDYADAQVKLPTVPTFKDVPASSPVLTVNLTKHGEVRFDSAQIAFGHNGLLAALKRDGLKTGMRSISLNEFGAYLTQAARVYHLNQRAKGKSAYDHVTGVRVCALTLDIHADRDAPLAHVMLLMTICAEQRYYKLRMAALRPDGTPGTLDARLPIYPARAPAKAVPKQRATVSLLATNEKEAKWGPPGRTATAKIATAVTCRYAQHSFDWNTTWAKPGGHAAVANWVQAMKRAKKPSAALFGEILASQKVPVQHFASVLAVFRSHGYASVDFECDAIPTLEARRATRLDYPVSNELPHR